SLSSSLLSLTNHPPPPPQLSTLSLHDALPILTFVDQVYQRAGAFLFGRRTYELFAGYWGVRDDLGNPIVGALNTRPKYVASTTRSEEHTSELQSLTNLVCRLLLVKKQNIMLSD